MSQKLGLHGICILKVQGRISLISLSAVWIAATTLFVISWSSSRVKVMRSWGHEVKLSHSSKNLKFCGLSAFDWKAMLCWVSVGCPWCCSAVAGNKCWRSSDKWCSTTEWRHWILPLLQQAWPPSCQGEIVYLFIPLLYVTAFKNQYILLTYGSNFFIKYE